MRTRFLEVVPEKKRVVPHAGLQRGGPGWGRSLGLVPERLDLGQRTA